MTIDQVDSAARREANYDQTVGLGTQALRAIAFYRLNRSAEANAALARISSARPYSASIQSLAHSVQMVFDPDRISRDGIIIEARRTLKRTVMYGQTRCPSVMRCGCWSGR